MVDCCIYRHVSGTVPSSYCGARLPSHYSRKYQALFLRTTVERGCLPTTTARRRTIHQLQLPAMFLVYVLPLLLQTLSEIKIWLIVVYVYVSDTVPPYYCGARLPSHYHRKKENDAPAATPSDVPRLRPSSSPPNT